jgi:hypothetical protein
MGWRDGDRAEIFIKEINPGVSTVFILLSWWCPRNPLPRGCVGLLLLLPTAETKQC